MANLVSSRTNSLNSPAILLMLALGGLPIDAQEEWSVSREPSIVVGALSLMGKSWW
jgi:hypothetical protein